MTKLTDYDRGYFTASCERHGRVFLYCYPATDPHPRMRAWLDFGSSRKEQVERLRKILGCGRIKQVRQKSYTGYHLLICGWKTMAPVLELICAEIPHMRERAGLLLALLKSRIERGPRSEYSAREWDLFRAIQERQKEAVTDG